MDRVLINQVALRQSSGVFLREIQSAMWRRCATVRWTHLHDLEILDIFALRLDHFLRDVVAGGLLGIDGGIDQRGLGDEGIVRVVR